MQGLYIPRIGFSAKASLAGLLQVLPLVAQDTGQMRQFLFGHCRAIGCRRVVIVGIQLQAGSVTAKLPCVLFQFPQASPRFKHYCEPVGQLCFAARHCIEAIPYLFLDYPRGNALRCTVFVLCPFPSLLLRRRLP